MVYRKLLFVLMCFGVCGLSATRKRIRIPINIDIAVHVKHRHGHNMIPGKHWHHKKSRHQTRNDRLPKRPRILVKKRLSSRVKKLEDQLNDQSSRITQLGNQFEQMAPGKDTEFLAAQMIALSRKVDELTVKLQQSEASGEEPSDATIQNFDSLKKQIDDLRGELKLQQSQSDLQEAAAQGAADRLAGLRAALNAYLMSEQKLLDDYETYRNSNYDPAATESSIQAIRDQLAHTWGSYTDSVDALNAILSSLGDEPIPVNQPYELMIKGALGL